MSEVVIWGEREIPIGSFLLSANSPRHCSRRKDHQDDKHCLHPANQSEATGIPGIDLDAVRHKNKELVTIKGANHYYFNQPDKARILIDEDDKPAGAAGRAD